MMRFFSIFLLSTALVSCSSNLVYEAYTEVENGWQYQNVIEHMVDVEGPAAAHDVFLNIRHTNDYPYSNLWVQVFTTNPDGQEVSQRFEITLAKPDGQWLGNSWGSTITQERLIMQGVKFQKPGKHVFKVQHDMRLNNVPAITHIGVRVEDASK